MAGVIAGLLISASPAQANSDPAHRVNATPAQLLLNVPTQRATAKMQRVRRSTQTVPLRRTFLDDFTNFAPNTPPWRHHFDHGPYDAHWARTLPSNGEQQLNVDPGYAGTNSRALRLNPFSLKDGVLGITGRKAPDTVHEALNGYEFTSGMISSEVAFEQQYGFFEARLRIPQGQGLWPAFWMKRSARLAPAGTSSWPPEIDVMEHISTEGDQYHVTVHWDLSPDNQMSGATIPVEAPSARFHNYGVLWGPERTIFYLDRQPVAMIETKENHHVPMYMMLNLALGGKWPGPVAENDLPATFEIDWVAAWQFTDN